MGPWWKQQQIRGICLVLEANGCVVSYSPKQVEKLKSKCLQRRQAKEPIHLATGLWKDSGVGGTGRGEE